MKIEHIPKVGLRYWLSLSIASIAGASMGDLLARDLGLGHWFGLPILLILFRLLMMAEQRSHWITEVFYWSAILLVRAAATNVGDLATHDLKIDDLLISFGVAFGLVLLAHFGSGLKADGQPRANTLYWMTMFVAGVLGTTLGDGCADLFGLGNSLIGWVVFSALAIVVAVQLCPMAPLHYWATVAVVRTMGTNGGDYLAGRHGLRLGLPITLALSIVALVGLLAWWRPQVQYIDGNAHRGSETSYVAFPSPPRGSGSGNTGVNGMISGDGVFMPPVLPMRATEPSAPSLRDDGL